MGGGRGGDVEFLCKTRALLYNLFLLSSLDSIADFCDLFIFEIIISIQTFMLSSSVDSSRSLYIILYTHLLLQPSTKDNKGPISSFPEQLLVIKSLDDTVAMHGSAFANRSLLKCRPTPPPLYNTLN